MKERRFRNKYEESLLQRLASEDSRWLQTSPGRFFLVASNGVILDWDKSREKVTEMLPEYHRYIKASEPGEPFQVSYARTLSSWPTLPLQIVEGGATQ